MNAGHAFRTDQDVDRAQVVHVIQGEYHVSSRPDAVLTTVLGSCVAACIFDARSGIGGMNHFLLPGDDERSGNDDLRYGVHAMELLINGIMKLGARRDALQAKLFGGAEIVAGLSRIGGKNGAFATRYLEKEGIPMIGGSLGGVLARRIQFWPASGRARQIFVREPAKQIAEAELKSLRRPSAPDGDLELF